MGYTHYWYRHPENETPDLYGRLALDAMRLVQVAAARGIAVEAEFTEGHFSVNGVGPQACEDFWWPASLNPGGDAIDGSVFSFTKTRLRPYDALVTALLLRARVIYQATGMTFASDGTWDASPYGDGGDWLAGRALYGDAFNESFPTHLEPLEIP